MTHAQMLLPVSKTRQEYNPHDFVFSDCNIILQEIINNLPLSSGVMPYKNIMLITGDNKSGKTHFCHLFASKTGAEFVSPGQTSNNDYIIIDDIDHNWDEEELLHIFNNICETGMVGLFTAKEFEHFKLKDLQSRINSVRLFKIGQPDDIMVRMILLKHLASRNITVTEDVIKYLMVRIPRNFESIFKSIDLIDKLALEQKRNVNVSFLASLFD